MPEAEPLEPVVAVGATKDVRHYAYIDALRGIAFLGVLAVHLLDALVWTGKLSHPLPDWANVLIASGRTGVQLFFVISALTLVMSMRSRKAREKRPTQNFFIRRFFRIAPLFWTVILLYSFTDQKRFFLQNVQAPEGVHWWHTLMTFAMVHTWYPTTFNSVVPGDWSVGVEMSFYVLMPTLAVIVTTPRRAAVAILSACLGGLFVTKVMVHFAAAGWTRAFAAPFHIFTEFWLPMELPVFLMGFVLYFLLERDRKRDIPAPAAQAASIRRLAAAFFLFIATTYSAGRLRIPEDWLFGAAFTLGAWGLAKYPWPVAVNPWIRYVGTVSYSCYLCHFFVVYVITRALAREAVSHLGHPVSTAVLFAVFYVVALAITLVISTLTYRFIEQPGIAAGKFLIAKNEARTA